ncbi:MAG: hypothetical protein ABF247_03505 [Nonlabens sp.]|uniref:hypothetical protein n=1 Tax=Nonlabens sp. TaxID=1888209 RepID=UPI00321C0FBA
MQIKKVLFTLFLFINGTSLLYSQEFEEIAIDSILSIQMPFDTYYYTENDSIDGITRLVHYADVDDVSYFVYRIRTDDLSCYSNKREMKKHYKDVSDYLVSGRPQKRVKYNSTFIDKDVLQGVIEYNDLDAETEELYNSDFRFIQIKETMYQVSLYQPVKGLKKSTADDFFNSIYINPDYTKENQYTECNSFDALFNNENDPEKSNAYNTGYALGYMAGGVLCFLLVAGLVVLAIVLIVRNNRKKSQEQWDEFNERS